MIDGLKDWIAIIGLTLFLVGLIFLVYLPLAGFVMIIGTGIFFAAVGLAAYRSIINLLSGK